MNEDPKFETKYGAPKDVQFCIRCVISNQRPSSVVEFREGIVQRKPTIEFDDSGVCSACQFSEIKKNQIDWQSREKELVDLLDRHRRSDGGFDCIVPGSGGKDSRFISHTLKYKYRMNPLTVTWTPHDYTDIGRRNFETWHEDGFSNFLISPNRKIHRYLTREAFLTLGHPFQPFIIGQRSIGPKLAKMLGISLVFYGENQAEYGNNISENDVPFMSPEFFEGENSDKSVFLGGRSISEHLDSNPDLRSSDFELYRPLSPESAMGIEYAYLGYFLEWDPQEIYYFAVENTKFEASTERTPGSYSKYSSIDDKIDMIHYYTTLVKFGIGRATYDAAQEIRNGKITRDEGVALVRKFDHEFPSRYKKDILSYLRLTETEFSNSLEKFFPPHLWEKVGGRWRLKHTVHGDDTWLG